MLKFYLLAGLIFFSLSCATTKTGMDQITPELAASAATLEMARAINVSRDESILKPVTPAGKTFVMSFGPKLLELKGSYIEKLEQATAPSNPLEDGKLRRYLNLLATSSFAGSGLTGEGELSYSPLDPVAGQCACKDWPRMLRLGLKNRWGGLSYGADYKSIDRGFVSIAGVAADQARDEGQLWGEHSLGPFNLRGSVGESWEKLLDVNGLRVTKNATACSTSIGHNGEQAAWSSYEWIELAQSKQEMTAFTNTSQALSPIRFLTVNPNFSIREERNAYMGARTETPRTELIFAYTPSAAFRFTGTTSLARKLWRTD